VQGLEAQGLGAQGGQAPDIEAVADVADVAVGVDDDDENENAVDVVDDVGGAGVEQLGACHMGIELG